LCLNPLTARGNDKLGPIRQTEIELALGWASLLKPDHQTHLSERQLAWTARQRAMALGLVRRNRSIHRRLVDELINQGGFNDTVRQIGFSFDGIKLRNFLLGYRLYENPLHTVMMLNVLYGTWEAVEIAAACFDVHDVEMQCAPSFSDERRSASPPPSHLPPVSPKASLELDCANAGEPPLDSTAVNQYIELRELHPDLSHSQITLRMSSRLRPQVTVSRLKSIGIEVERERKRRPQSSEHESTTAIARYQQLQRESPHLLHTEIVIRLPSRLRRHLTIETLRKSGITVRAGKRDAVTQEHRVAQTAQAVLERALSLVAKKFHRRICRKHLLLGLPQGEGITRKPKTNRPHIDDTLNLLRESSVEHRRRIMIASRGIFSRIAGETTAPIEEWSDELVTKIWLRAFTLNRLGDLK